MIGSQVPRVANGNQGVWSEAEECSDLAASYGLTPDPWQEFVLDLWLRRDKFGRWANGRWGIAVPRQNGKNGILEMVELYFMVLLGLKVLHTAHEVKTARKAFLRVCSFFENERDYPELAEMVKSIRKTNGQEAIELTNGGSVEFVARSKGSARGFTVDVLVCDEAQEYGEEAQAALLPTISSSPSGDPLQILLGTPPSGSMDGTVFSRLRAAGLAGADRVAWAEWSVADDAVISDKETWFSCNPSLGIRLNLNTVLDEYGSMSNEMFARERLGKWDGAGGASAFDFTQWRSLVSEPVDGTPSFGVKFAADGSHVALGACMKSDDGSFFVEGIREASLSEGTQWLVDFLVLRKDRTAQIVIDGRAGVGFLVQALRDEKVGKPVILTPTVEQAVTAHTMFEQAVTQGSLGHSGQTDLDNQVKSATRRKIGNTGAFGWAPSEELGSVGLLDAVTLAHFGARTTKRKPGRKQRFS